MIVLRFVSVIFWCCEGNDKILYLEVRMSQHLYCVDYIFYKNVRLNYSLKYFLLISSNQSLKCINQINRTSIIDCLFI
jgi:hypothetical protein